MQQRGVADAFDFGQTPVLDLREIVREKLGVKAAGGIRDTLTAIAMIEAGASRLGTSSGVAIVRGLAGASPGVGLY